MDHNTFYNTVHAHSRKILVSVYTDAFMQILSYETWTHFV